MLNTKNKKENLSRYFREVKSSPQRVRPLANRSIAGKNTKLFLLAASIILFSSPASYAQVIAGGLWHSLSVCSDGTARAWGRNKFGQLGDGTDTSRNTPVQVSGLTGVLAIAGEWQHSIALKNDGTVWAWGNNWYGQLGDGTNTDKLTPVQVSGLTGVLAIAGGGDHNIALKNDGTVWAWGYNSSGQLGDGTTYTAKNTPVQVSGLTGAVAIAGGGEHSIALKNDGTVWAWGYNQFGQLGDGDNTNKNTPVQVTGLTGAVAVAGGATHSIALKNDGTVWAWGDNSSGQLGDGTDTNKNIPVQVSGLTGAVAIAGGGGAHSIALKNDGTVWAWGWNNYGQLGDGANTDKNIPVPVSGLTGAVAIAEGYDHSIALKNDGTVWAWGSNGDGQLGDGTSTDKNTPVQVQNLCNVATTGINTKKSEAIEATVSVYPNPFSEQAMVRITNASEFANGKMELKIYDMLGGIVKTTNLKQQTTSIERGNLPNGIYFYKVSNQEKETVATGKLIIK